MLTRADLHVHSKYSDRPSEWILRRLGAPECYTSPRAVYDLAKRRGMDFVTISDHNCINGALDIAHLPGAFISNEITAYFPEDGCKVHVLCWGITPVQFEEIERLRPDIVELRDYMHAEGIVHACAHPLYSVNDRLTIDHFERLLVLFNVFETMNGGRNQRGNDLVASIVSTLSQPVFERMVDRHGLAPAGTDPWVKGTTGGSDDHSGAFIAKGFTECPSARTPREFLAHVAARRSNGGGLDGTPLSFAHSLYKISYQYYRDKFLAGASGGDLVVRMMGEVFGKEQVRVRFKDRVTHLAGQLSGRHDRSPEVEFKRFVSTEMTQLFGEDWLHDDFAMRPARYRELNERTFQLASRMSNELLFQFGRRFVDRLASGSIFDSLQALSAVAPVVLGMAPYLFAFAHQNRDKAFLDDVSVRFLGTSTEPAPRAACLVDATMQQDTERFVQMLDRVPEVAVAARTILSFGTADPAIGGRVQMFNPVGYLTLPGGDGLSLAFPPFLDFVDYLDREQFTTIVVGAPSLAGLAALAAARLLNIRLVAVFQSDVSAMIKAATDDESAEAATWPYVRWFYEQAEVVYASNDAAARQLVVKGFNRDRLRILSEPEVLVPAV